MKAIKINFFRCTLLLLLTSSCIGGGPISRSYLISEKRVLKSSDQTMHAHSASPEKKLSADRPL
ncbi:MAG: hypothetical protein K0S74_1627 [Chlamydiales bacterium]|jgi:hypothetical protein|nr:hypothetical protein [Chlamydiales bacterium]